MANPLPSAAEIFAVSAVAKLGATLATYPLLLVKQRLQSAGRHTHAERQYSGTVDAVRRIWRTEGTLSAEARGFRGQGSLWRTESALRAEAQVLGPCSTCRMQAGACIRSGSPVLLLSPCTESGARKAENKGFRVPADCGQVTARRAESSWCGRCVEDLAHRGYGQDSRHRQTLGMWIRQRLQSTGQRTQRQQCSSAAVTPAYRVCRVWHTEDALRAGRRRWGPAVPAEHCSHMHALRLYNGTVAAGTRIWRTAHAHHLPPSCMARYLGGSLSGLWRPALGNCCHMASAVTEQRLACVPALRASAGWQALTVPWVQACSASTAGLRRRLCR